MVKLKDQALLRLAWHYSIELEFHQSCPIQHHVGIHMYRIMVKPNLCITNIILTSDLSFLMRKTMTIDSNSTTSFKSYVFILFRKLPINSSQNINHLIEPTSLTILFSITALKFFCFSYMPQRLG